MAARFEVWNRTNTAKVADLTTATDGPIAATIDEEINAPGRAQLRLEKTHPALSDVEGGRIVRCYDDTDLVSSFVITDVETIERRDPERDQTVDVNGRGLLWQWEAVTVDPWIPGRPISQDRVFNWASPPLNLSGWNNQVWNRPGVGKDFKLPEAWPVDPQFNSWVWSSSYAAPSPPWTVNDALGQSIFRKQFTLAAQQTIVIYFAGKRTWDLWLDGVLLEREPVSINQLDGYEQTWRYVVTVSAGTHHFAARVHNAGGGLAGFIAACFSVSGGRLSTLLWSSAQTVSGWYSKHMVILEPPFGTLPGFTAPQIINLLLDEAKDRGALTNWTTVTYGTHSEIEEFACRVGDTYLDVLDALAASYVDIRVEPDTLTLGIYPKGELGQVRAINYQDAEVESLERAVSDDIVNYAKAVYRSGHTFRQNAASVAANGARETTLSLPNVARSSAHRILDTYLDAFSEPLETVTAVVVPVAGKRPGVNYIVGDSIEVLSEEHRVVGIAYQLRDDGTLEATPQLRTLLDARRRDRQLAIERQVARFEQPATAQVLDAGTQIPSGRVRTMQTTWSWPDELDDEDELGLGQPFEPDRTMRIYELSVEINEEDLPDAWGNSTFELNRNGVLPGTSTGDPFSWGLFNLTLTTSAARAEVFVGGFTVVESGRRYGPRCIAAGGHVKGVYTMKLADAI